MAALTQVGRHIERVEWQGQPVWLKLSLPAWLRALRWLPRRMQRHDVLKAQCVGELARHCTPL